MSRLDNIASRSPAYVLSSAAGVLAAALGGLLDLPEGWRYALALVILTVTVSALLARELFAERQVPDSYGFLEMRRTESRSASRLGDSRRAHEEFVVTRLRLGLEHLQAQSGEASEAQALWLPSSDPSQAAWLKVDGPDLVVGARAALPGPQFARIGLAELNPIYVLLLAGPDPGTGSGRATVPGLAADLADQLATTAWLSLDELPGEDAEAIAASVAYASHATRAAWREVVCSLPAGHPVRVAVERSH